MSEISLRRSPRLRKRDVRLGLLASAQVTLSERKAALFPSLPSCISMRLDGRPAQTANTDTDKREKGVVRRCYCYTLSGAVEPPLGYLRHFAAVTEPA